MEGSHAYDKPLSVAFYMHDFSGGGVEQMRLRLAEALAAKGVSVSIIVQEKSGALTNALPKGIAVVTLGTSRTAQHIVPLWRLLHQGRYDTVVSSLHHNNIAILIARMLTGPSTPVIICQHNALTAEVSLGWKYRLVPLLYTLLWRFAAAIIAVSDGVARDLSVVAAIPREAVTVIYNPVIGDCFWDSADWSLPHDWFADRTVPVFLFVGRLTRQKDPQTLLRAMSLFLKARFARLIILGEGELAEDLARLTSSLGLTKVVHYAGFQRNPLPWIKHASALVLSSRYEGLGNVIIEALACGTPVIATDCPCGPAEILQGGKLGQLVPVGDPSALARAMLDYGGQNVTPAERRARAADFSATICADRHLDLIGRVLVKTFSRRGRAFGLDLTSLDACACAEHILAVPADGKVRLMVTPNINHLRNMRSPEFACAYSHASLICADGLPLVLYARWLGLPVSRRVTGCDVFHQLAQSPALKSHRLFFVVECEATATVARTWVKDHGLAAQTEIAVAATGLSDTSVAQCSLADTIRNHGTTILVVTLGAPVSEIFVHRNRHRLPACWALCIGQAFRVELGLVTRAPRRWQSSGLEWAWRLRQEPRRLALRYLLDAVWFPVAVARDVLSRPGQTK